MSIKRAVLLVLCAALIAVCVYQAYQTPDALQYAVAAPKAVAKADDTLDAGEDGQTGEGGQAQAEKSELRALLKTLQKTAGEWTGILSAYAVTGSHTQVAMEGTQTQTAALTGVYGAFGVLGQKLLSSGRYFYPEEMESGARVLVLDEQLAIALFRVGDPIGRAVQIGESRYTVIGVIKHTRTPGEKAAYGAYAPLLSLEDDGIQTQVLTVWAKAVPGAGASSRFKDDMAAWRAGGSLYSLSKERMRALMPARILLCVLGALLLLEGFRFLLRMIKRCVADIRARLEHTFAVRLTGRMAAYTGAGVICLAALLAAFYFIVQFALEPVYVFPEWIPAVLVEPADILSTFWQNRAAGGELIEYRTREILSLRFYQGALTLLCAVAGGALLHGQGARRARALKAARAKQAEATADIAPTEAAHPGKTIAG